MQRLNRLSIRRVTSITELIWRLRHSWQKSWGQELVIQNMDFDAVCLSVGQQKCDIAMAGLTINEEREEYVTFSDPYYQASQRLVVRSDDSAFDDCEDADAVAAKLGELESSDKIGVQQGTTGQYYVEGDEMGFDGFGRMCSV